MSTHQERLQQPSGEPSHHRQHGITLPVIGFVLSIILTLIALWAVMNRVLGAGSLIALILILGAIQIFIQLFFFMHVTESKGPNWHAWMLALGLVFVIAIVAGSIWIMAFGALSY